MGRRRRPYLPGGVFHLTARTLRREHRLDPPLRTAALGAIAAAAIRSRARILAVAVMSNHLHVVVQQADKPLAALMQPLLRRLALRVQHAHGLEGPVFWRPYASQPCLNPSHVRNAIVYTHLNPVRADVVDDPGRYPWTSHLLYSPAAPLPLQLGHLEEVLDPALALPLFATGRDRSLIQLRGDYDAFVRWRLEADRAEHMAEGEDPAIEPPLPWHISAWGHSLSPLFHAPPHHRAGDENDARPSLVRPDLAALARTALASEAPGMRMETVRGRRGGPRIIRLRHVIIRRLHAAGFRNVEIARYLDLSESAISYVLCKRPVAPRPSGGARTNGS